MFGYSDSGSLPSGGLPISLPSSRKTQRQYGLARSLLAAASLVISASAADAAGPAPVALGKAGFFVILSEAGIQDVPGSAITGNVGTSPITGAADLLSCTEVTGRVFSVDATGPSPCGIAKAKYLTLAVGAVTTAYNDAAGRIPDVKELGAGNIGGLTIAPGTYSWSSSVTIPANLTLHGKAKDVWIFQVAQNVDIAAATSVFLTGGANAKNVFWQVAGQVTMGTTSHFQGIVLSATQIAMKTGATVTGRLYAQTAVTLEMNTVTRPRG